uniref:Glucose-methanol-choline oxidoreductase N-terminal domain-containing protein n=1 Tax=Parascaris univalens TaxID=6257 RepID=A0A915BPQ0_PARUN
MLQSCCANRSSTFDRSKSSVDESLRVIDISNQYLEYVTSKSFVSSLPNVVIENRHRIEHLILDGNKFTEHSLNVPSFDNLVTLSLNSNMVSGQAMPEIDVPQSDR